MVEQTASPPNDSTCRRCSCALRQANRVRLWDGRDYCRACVEEALPGLADYAAMHPVLEDRLPFDFRDLLWATVRFYSVLYAGLVGIFAIACVVQRSLRDFVIGLGWALLVLGVPVATACALHLLWKWSRSKHTQFPVLLSATNGQVTTHWATGGGISYALHGANWALARVSRRFARRHGYAERRTLIVRHVVPATTPVSEMFAISPAGAARWQAFLKLANVPGGPNYELIGCLAMLVSALLGGCLVAFCDVLLATLVPGAKSLANIAGAGFAAGGVGGLIWSFIYYHAIWFRNNWESPRTPWLRACVALCRASAVPGLALYWLRLPYDTQILVITVWHICLALALAAYEYRSLTPDEE